MAKYKLGIIRFSSEGNLYVETIKDPSVNRKKEKMIKDFIEAIVESEDSGGLYIPSDEEFVGVKLFSSAIETLENRIRFSVLNHDFKKRIDAYNALPWYKRIFAKI